MQYKVHSSLATDEDDFFDMNPGARAIKEFNDCTSRQMFFVCLVADTAWDSPLRSLPEPERRKQATQVAGWGMEDDRPDKNARNLIAGKVLSVEEAIKAYRKNQYDEDKAMWEATDAQIKEIITMMSRDKQEACKIVKTKYNDKTKETVTTEYVDQVMASKLALEATKLGVQLPVLKEARQKLAENVRVSVPIDDVLLHTGDDLDGDGVGDAEMSLLDIHMAKKKIIQDGGQQD